MKINRFFITIGAITLLSLTACTSNVVPYQYDKLLAAKPRSILILPPLNESLEVNAPYIELSTLSRPLGEKGYYIFPVAVIENFMKENGLPTTVEMNKVPLDKLYEHIGADAVLYTNIKQWGQEYNIIDSSTVVNVYMKLVDAKTGALLWDADASAVSSTNDGNNGGLLGSLILAAIDQIAGDIQDRTPALSRVANYNAIYNKDRGLLNGPYAVPQHPQ